MAGEWSVAALDDLVGDILDRRGVTPLKLGSDFVQSGHRVISAKLIKNRHVDLGADEPRFVDDLTYNKWMRTPLQADDVILTSEAPLGELAYIDGPRDWCLGQRLFCIRTLKDRLHGRFLYYALQSFDVVNDLMSRGTGTTVQGIRQTELRRVRIPHPVDVTEQRAIAHILGTLDDKIELNRRMSETLEATARALFKSWFVVFDPVRIKVEGRDTRLPAHLADLFPVSFDDSELGEIPQGWGLSALSDCVEVDRGLSYKGAGLSESGMPMHNLNSIFEGGGYKHEGIKHYRGEYKPHHVARAGDLIVANTEQGHKRLLIGYAAIVPDRFGEPTLFSHHIYRVRPKRSSVFTPDWLCHLLNSRKMHDTVSGYANGTTVNMLPVDGLQSPPIVVPPPALIRAFDGLAVAARKRQGEMNDENRTLVHLRDVLLPRLISGEMRLCDASQLVEVEPND